MLYESGTICPGLWCPDCAGREVALLWGDFMCSGDLPGQTGAWADFQDAFCPHCGHDELVPVKRYPVDEVDEPGIPVSDPIRLPRRRVGH